MKKNKYFYEKLIGFIVLLALLAEGSLIRSIIRPENTHPWVVYFTVPGLIGAAIYLVVLYFKRRKK